MASLEFMIFHATFCRMDRDKTLTTSMQDILFSNSNKMKKKKKNATFIIFSLKILSDKLLHIFNLNSL